MFMLISSMVTTSSRLGCLSFSTRFPQLQERLPVDGPGTNKHSGALEPRSCGGDNNTGLSNHHGGNEAPEMSCVNKGITERGEFYLLSFVFRQGRTWGDMDDRK